MPEAGHGRHLNTPSDTVPKTHSVEEMVLLVGGRAGGLTPGRHIATAGAHPGQCLISCDAGRGLRRRHVRRSHGQSARAVRLEELRFGSARAEQRDRLVVERLQAFHARAVVVFGEHLGPPGRGEPPPQRRVGEQSAAAGAPARRRRVRGPGSRCARRRRSRAGRRASVPSGTAPGALASLTTIVPDSRSPLAVVTLGAMSTSAVASNAGDLRVGQRARERDVVGAGRPRAPRPRAALQRAVADDHQPPAGRARAAPRRTRGCRTRAPSCARSARPSRPPVARGRSVARAAA